MVNLVGKQPRLLHQLGTYGHFLELLLEVSLVVASFLFVVGCVYFLPAYENVHRGCLLFIIGSVIFAIVETYHMIEAVLLSRMRVEGATRVSRRALLEKFLYVVGSVVFMIGAVLWDPSLDPRTSRKEGYTRAHETLVATVYFILGSGLFVSSRSLPS